MRRKISDLKENDMITITASNDVSELKLKAEIIKILRSDIAVIDIKYKENNRLNFNNVNLDFDFIDEDGILFLWRNVKIVNVKNQYVMQSTVDGIKHNRRGCFRVYIGCYAHMSTKDKRLEEVLVKDISLSGFAIADRDKKLNLDINDELMIHFNEFGYEIKLIGTIVRVEERENVIIYGLHTKNLCKDLSQYINLKQQKNRQNRTM